VANGVVVFNERIVRRSEVLQLLLLDSLYAQPGTGGLIFQGGTALRWVYGGARFSEDLDFVTDLPGQDVETILERTFKQVKRACVAQFGPGRAETKDTGQRKGTIKRFFVYYPENTRERVAVKLEFERLRKGFGADAEPFILRDLPALVGLLTNGQLLLSYSSSIIVAETLEEILSDKIRALYERPYIKGRDLFDIWWLRKQRKVTLDPTGVQRKLTMYETPFVAARETGYFQTVRAASAMADALKNDLPRFLPQTLFSQYEKGDFAVFAETVKEVTAILAAHGLDFIPAT